MQGRSYWKLGMRLLKKDKWRLTKKKRERLKGVHKKQKGGKM